MSIFAKEEKTKYRDKEGNLLSDDGGLYKLVNGQKVYRNQMNSSEINQLLKSDKQKRKKEKIEAKIKRKKQKIKEKKDIADKRVELQKRKKELRKVKRKNLQLMVKPAKDVMDKLHSIGGNKEGFDFGGSGGGIFDFSRKNDPFDHSKGVGNKFDFSLGKNNKPTPKQKKKKQTNRKKKSKKKRGKK